MLRGKSCGEIEGEEDAESEAESDESDLKEFNRGPSGGGCSSGCFVAAAPGSGFAVVGVGVLAAVSAAVLSAPARGIEARVTRFLGDASRSPPPPPTSGGPPTTGGPLTGRTFVGETDLEEEGWVGDDGSTRSSVGALLPAALLGATLFAGCCCRCC